MSAGTMTITEFLEARIAEDEAVAREAAGVERGEYFVAALPNLLLEQVARFGPARVLAECAAKRAIINEHEIDLEMRDPYCDSCAEWWKCVLGEGPPMVKYPCPTVRAIAAVYKDHPDYQQGWAA